MGFFSKLFGAQDDRPYGHLPGPGTYSIDIVGESHYQEALEDICGGRSEESAQEYVEATLVLDDDNPYDDKAVRVDIEGETVGHLDRPTARAYRERLKEAASSG